MFTQTILRAALNFSQTENPKMMEPFQNNNISRQCLAFPASQGYALVIGFAHARSIVLQ